MAAKRNKPRTTLITGGAGFIGSHYANRVVQAYPSERFVIVDALTSVSNKKNLSVLDQPHVTFIQADIRDLKRLQEIFSEHKPTHVVHFAAETHVDVSIKNPLLFLETNVLGTYNLLTCAKDVDAKRFTHISTDEVYGALGKKDRPRTEHDAQLPNSPYSASKAGAEHIVRAFAETYGLHTVIVRCSNNYGPGQDASKFIPVCINTLIKGGTIPVYGRGLNIRDWIYVADAVEAIDLVERKGARGSVYNIGGGAERTNIEIARAIVKAFKAPKSAITFVTDRPGHDFRYALNTKKIRSELGWKPHTPFEKGLALTIQWYRDARSHAHGIE